MAEERDAAGLQQPDGRRGKIAGRLRTYYYDLFAAHEDAEGRTCPGERVCTEDEEEGEIARDASRTLQTYCLRGRCPLWPTKVEEGVMPAAAPPELWRFIDAADEMAGDAAVGATVDRRDYGMLEWAAFKAREVAAGKVRNRPRDDKGKPILTPDDPAHKPDGPPGDGAAINW